MACTDFIFDGETLSDHGYIICMFDGESISWEGGDVSFTTIKLPNSDRQVFCTSSQETPLSTVIQICKNPCQYLKQEDMYITQNDYSELYHWLQRTDGYHWLHFFQDDFEDVFYNCMINLEPYFINGRTCGFTLNIITDSPYGYSNLINKKFVLDRNNPKYKFKDYSDKPGITHVKTTITPLETGKPIHFFTGNGVYIQETLITGGANINTPIVLDGENDYFSGLSNPNAFNFGFPIIANSYKDRENTFWKWSDSFIANIMVEIEYRHKRRVIV